MFRISCARVPAFRGPLHQESLSDVGGIEASDSARALLRSIVLACIETIVSHDFRAPVVSLNGTRETSGYAVQWVSYGYEMAFRRDHASQALQPPCRCFMQTAA